ncbi:hypothetical protein [Pseudophaeobacter sp.]|uniref:hypothetical protein n=1 Tax=Pseudophaeobacter sp. TaxID=1971739 RepID=UPI003297BE88
MFFGVQIERFGRLIPTFRVELDQFAFDRSHAHTALGRSAVCLGLTPHDACALFGVRRQNDATLFAEGQRKIVIFLAHTGYQFRKLCGFYLYVLSGFFCHFFGLIKCIFEMPILCRRRL